MRIIVIAGPNGAGKSTLARHYLKDEPGSPPFVNGDEIAARLNPDDPDAAALEAGRMALRQTEAYVKASEDFAIETTLSGRGYAARIRRWQAAGYRVTIIYLRLSSADQTVARVARRVREGGHDIPEAIARRRFERSWNNFVGLYRDLADEWKLYDNSGSEPALIAESAGWRGGREPRPRAVLDDTVAELLPATADHDGQDAQRRRIPMTSSPRRFPDDEPSHENIMAALIRARADAMARAAAVAAAEASPEPTEEVTAAASAPDRRGPATSAAGSTGTRLPSDR